MADTINTWGSDWEEKKNIDWKKKEGIESVFLRKFWEYILNTDDKLDGFSWGKADFFDALSNLDRISAQDKDAIIILMKKFGADHEEFETGIDYDKINLYSVRRKFLSSIIKQNTQKVQLKNIFLKEYEIGNTLILEDKIKNSSGSLREKMLEDSDERKKFLQEAYAHKKVPKKKNLLKDLEDLKLGKNYKKFNEEQKNALATFLKRVGFSADPTIEVNIHDIGDLFSSGIFSEKDKAEILKAFVPVITLKEAVDMKLISRKTADKYKITLFLEHIDSDLKKQLQWKKELQVELENMFHELQDSNLFISTDKINVKKHIDILLEHKWYEAFLWNIKEVSGKLQWYAKIKSLSDFKEILSQQKWVEWADRFDVGNYIVFNHWKTSEYPEWELSFMKIEDIPWGDAGQINLLHKGKGKLDYRSKISHKDNFDHFIERVGTGLQKWSIEWVEIITETEILKRTKSWKIDTISAIGWVPEKEVEGKIVAEKKQIQKKTQELKTRLKATEKYKSFFACEKDWDPDTDECNHRDNEINAERWLDEAVWNDKDWDSSAEKSLKKIESYEETNINTILKWDGNYQWIDVLDPAGEKYGFKLGTTFVVDGDHYFTITELDPLQRTLKLENPWWGKEPQMSFDAFLEWFRAKKTVKRVWESQDLYNLLDTMTSHDEKWWKWYKINGKSQLTKKVGSKDKEEELAFDYLVSTSSKELLKIHKVVGDRIIVSTWEVKDKKKYDKKEWEEKKVGEIFVSGGPKYTVTAGFLEGWIKRHKMIPRSLEEWKIQAQKREEYIKDTQWAKDKKWNPVDGRHAGMWNKLFSNYSIGEVLMWGKMFLDSFEKYLKEWNEEHAAIVAYKVFWKHLPDEVKNDLLSRMEGSQKKRLDEYVQKLKDIDSPIATKLILKRLLDKNTPEYKKEAGLEFMLMKYGSLYSKAWWLIHYTGTYLWYRAFGWEVWDKFFMEQQKDAADRDVNFTEEDLMYAFIKKQCKDDGFKGIKRRSRLHKEVKALRGKWKEDEKKTWLNDAGEPRTIQWRIDVAMGEFFGGTRANGVGWIEAVINKWWELHEMNIMPFVMAFSGIGYLMDQDILDAAKNLPDSSKLLSLMRMLSLKSDMDLVNDTILELSKKIWKERGDPKMYARALELHWKIHDSWNIQGRMDAVIKFYKTEVWEWENRTSYWELLTNSMYMVNNGDTTEKSKFNSMVYLEKDSNKTLGKFYDKMHGYAEGSANFDKNPDMIIDSFQWTGISWLNLKKATRQLINMQAWGWFYKTEAWPEMWREIHSEFEAILEREYLWDTEEEKEANKKRDLVYKLKEFIAGVSLSSWMKEYGMLEYNRRWSTTSTYLNKWWINLHKISSEYGITADRIANSNDEWVNTVISDIADDMIHGIDKSAEVDEYIKNYRNPIKTVEDHTTEAANDVIWEDYYWEKAA